ncbi:hypothetical protein OHT57_35345 [Streptomyces sp. NBC_00285]|uniref:hypothetical protein n=1 Tax=Streptomyces sp. NBC_00285 TaxID=2975700 RepID=UPI002E2B4F22|nr:hypothetical protein [Streptomyces sp. NBC_00285]
MSLSVEVFVRDPDGELRILDVSDDVYRSGGFESWRTTVWGSEFVRSLGARFLPVLAARDLYVEAEDVPEFRREVALLRSRIDEVATDGRGAPGPDRDSAADHRGEHRRGPGDRRRGSHLVTHMDNSAAPGPGGCRAGGGGRYGERAAGS